MTDGHFTIIPNNRSAGHVYRRMCNTNIANVTNCAFFSFSVNVAKEEDQGGRLLGRVAAHEEDASGLKKA